ncbi:MAG: Smr/MutS family protein [Fibrobacterota bacterium]
MFEFLRRKRKKKQEKTFPKDSCGCNEILDYVDLHGIIDKDSCSYTEEDEKKHCSSRTSSRETPVQSEEKHRIISGSTDAFWEQEDLSPGQKYILEYTDERGFFGAQKEEFFTERQSTERKTDVPTGRERRIDLHGCTLNDARDIVRTALDDAPSQGVKQLLIIHGKGFDGRGILKEEIRRLLREEWRMGIKSFEYAPPRDGGSGATRVYLY